MNPSHERDMRNRTLLAASGLLIALVTPALAERGGDRTPAGGPFMSSYSRGPYATDGRYAPPEPAQVFGGAARPDEPVATGSIGRRERSRQRVR